MTYEIQHTPHGPFLPAPVPQATGLPPRVSWPLLVSGKAPLVYMGLGSYERPAVTTALSALLRNLHHVQAWENLLVSAGTVADVYIYDRHAERYRLLDVLVDPGEETGQLVLRHMGKKARQGDIQIDIHETYGFVFPVVVYKSTRIAGNPRRGR